MSSSTSSAASTGCSWTSISFTSCWTILAGMAERLRVYFKTSGPGLFPKEAIALQYHDPELEKKALVVPPVLGGPAAIPADQASGQLQALTGPSMAGSDHSLESKMAKANRPERNHDCACYDSRSDHNKYISIENISTNGRIYIREEKVEQYSRVLRLFQSYLTDNMQT